MEQPQSNTTQARRTVVDDLIARLHREGPKSLGVVRNKASIAETLADVVAGLRAMAQNDGGKAFRKHLMQTSGVDSITLTAEDLLERIALAEQDLRGVRDTLGRLRESKPRMIANAVDPVAKAAWIASVEADLMKSEQASLRDLEKYTEWLPLAPVVLTRG